MSIDLSTVLGVLGVLLTILFFFIGYRQTIGARKERARAANKSASDALFRRLTLENQFAIDFAGVNKLLSGFALDARVRLSDMYSTDELEAVLFYRIIESDYVPGDQRKDITRRLTECFKDTQYFPRIEEQQRQRANLGTEVVLAIASGATALVATTVGALVASRHLKGDMLVNARVETLLTAFLSVAVLIALTGLALTLFTRARENSRSTDERELSIAQRGLALERSFLAAAKRANASVEPLSHGWADAAFRIGEAKIAVELKHDVNRLPAPVLRRLVSRIEERCSAEGYSSAFIASLSRPSRRAKLGETEKVKIVEIPELLDIMRASRPA